MLQKKERKKERGGGGEAKFGFPTGETGMSLGNVRQKSTKGWKRVEE